MNHRELMHSPTATDYGLAMPEGDLAGAPDERIETAWRAALDTTMPFFGSARAAPSHDRKVTSSPTRADLMGFSPEASWDTLIAIVKEGAQDDGDPKDWERGDFRGHPDWRKAKSCVECDFADGNDSNLMIVDGCPPGTSNVAAAMPMDFSDANVIAADLRLPIHVMWGGD